MFADELARDRRESRVRRELSHHRNAEDVAGTPFRTLPGSRCECLVHVFHLASGEDTFENAVALIVSSHSAGFPRVGDQRGLGTKACRINAGSRPVPVAPSVANRYNDAT